MRARKSCADLNGSPWRSRLSIVNSALAHSPKFLFGSYDKASAHFHAPGGAGPGGMGTTAAWDLKQALELLCKRMPDVQAQISQQHQVSLLLLRRPSRRLRRPVTDRPPRAAAPPSPRSQHGEQLLQTWQKLLVQPSTTLPAGGCLRGLLTRVAGTLVDAVVAGRLPQQDTYAVGVALMRLLELSSGLKMWVPPAQGLKCSLHASRHMRGGPSSACVWVFVQLLQPVHNNSPRPLLLPPMLGLQSCTAVLQARTITTPAAAACQRSFSGSRGSSRRTASAAAGGS